MKLSIIIPTCNERQYLYKTINSVINHATGKERLEIIVVDCGSTDGTTSAIKHKSVVVVENPQLKGKKWQSLNLGGRLAQGEVLLFLDADTLVPPGYDSAILTALADERVVGGAFEFSFDQRSPLLWLITLINRIRYRVRQSYYGDQGIFVRSSAYKQSGGWPNKVLLETAYFCRELKKQGSLALLPLRTKTSSRRFHQQGTLKMFWYDLKVWILDLFGLDVNKYGEEYWRHQATISRRGEVSGDYKLATTEQVIR